MRKIHVRTRPVRLSTGRGTGALATNHVPQFKEAFLMSRVALRAFLFCVLFVAASHVTPAQSFVLDLPAPSQPAEVSQRIGLTDITIKYHRPLINDRKIWGALVPYGKVWRAGANENTTITFDDPVTIEGQPLAAGTYGLPIVSKPR